MNGNSCYSTSLPAFGVMSVLDFSHSSMFFWCSSMLIFSLHFSDDVGCGTSFHMLIYQLNMFFGEMCVEVFGPSIFYCVIFDC